MNKVRTISIIISVILSINLGYPKSLDKLYISLLTEKGIVYHTYPKDLDYIKNNSQNLSVSKLKYDYTYIDSTDSVDVLMTVSYTVLSKPTSIQFGNFAKCPLSIIYIDNKGKKFIYRVKCTIAYKEWIELYTAQTPLQINLLCEDDIKFSFHCPKKKWYKLQTNFTNLFKLIEKVK